MEMNCGSTTRRVTTRVSVIAMAAHVNSSDWNEAKTSTTAEVSFCSATSINPEMPNSTNAATIDRRTLRKAFHSPVWGVRTKTVMRARASITADEHTESIYE